MTPIVVISFFLFFLIPILGLAYLYLAMVVALGADNKQQIRRSLHTRSRTRPADSRRQTLAMLGQTN